MTDVLKFIAGYNKKPSLIEEPKSSRRTNTSRKRSISTKKEEKVEF